MARLSGVGQQPHTKKAWQNLQQNLEQINRNQAAGTVGSAGAIGRTVGQGVIGGLDLAMGVGTDLIAAGGEFLRPVGEFVIGAGSEVASSVSPSAAPTPADMPRPAAATAGVNIPLASPEQNQRQTRRLLGAEPNTGFPSTPPQIASITDTGISAVGERVRPETTFNFTPDQVSNAAGRIGTAGSYTGPTSTTGMTDEQKAAFETQQQADIASNAARMEAATAAIRDLRNARRAAEGSPPVGERRATGAIAPNSHADEWNAQFNERRRMEEGQKAGLESGALAAYAMGGKAAKSKRGSGDSTEPDLGDMISLANLERGLRSDQRREQQDGFRNNLDLARLGDSRSAEAHRQAEAQRIAARQQQQDFMAGAEPFMQQAAEQFSWLGDGGASYFQSASRSGQSPDQALNMLAGAAQQIGTMTEPLFTINGQAVSGVDAAKILKGEKPFGNWFGPGDDFYAEARRRAAELIQTEALKGLSR